MWWAHGGGFVNPGRLKQALKLIAGAGQHAAAGLAGSEPAASRDVTSALAAMGGANMCLNAAKAVVPLSAYEREYSKDAVRERRFFNIGAGAGWWHPCWTALDINSVEENCPQWDLMDRAPLPVGDGKAALMYSSHTIEHVDDDTVQAFFEEVFRCLEPGGGFRIVCPDVDIYYRAYREGAIEAFGPLIGTRETEGSIGQHFLKEFAGHASHLCPAKGRGKISDDELNRIFAEREYEAALDYCVSFCSAEEQRNLSPTPHINWFNYRKIERMLTRAGFKTVERSHFAQSRFFVLRDPTFFDFTYPGVSVFVDAVK
ncbi:MAG: methyltransferase domain-containing protein [Rhodospirillales bacterium]|nr:methyltransferase domain-containing protein [Rhodospirillales bacterium]